jgi:hypothetical protein
MATKSKDQYANIAAVNVNEAVAGTAAYARYAFPYSVTDKVAILISRIEYWFSSLTNLNSSTDNVIAALCAASAVVDLANQADPAIVDSTRVVRVDCGAAASGILVNQPFIKEFSSLPGGGILVAPSPLYAAVKSDGAAAVMGCWIKLFYTYKELATDEYWELVESRRIISS